MIYDEKSCSSRKTSPIPLAPLDMPSCMPEGDWAGGALSQQHVFHKNIRCVKMRKQQGL